MTAYDDLKNVLKSYSEAGQIYNRVAHFSDARNIASKFALEEGDQTVAEALQDPNTPFEKAVQGVGIGLGIAKSKLEDIVDKRFDEILNDKKVKTERLEASLISFKPKADKKYEKFADAHSVYRNLSLYNNRENPEEAAQSLSSMLKEVVSNYEKTYQEKKSDSDEVKEQKNLIKQFFLSFYIDRNGRPLEEGRLIARKYHEINKDKLKFFGEKIKNRKYLVNYIKETLPENKELRVNFLSSLIG